LVKSTLLWLVSLCFIFACVKWFQHQPYSQQENPLDDIRDHQSKREVVATFIRFALSVPLFLLPVLLAFITPAWIHTRKARIAASTALAALVLMVVIGAYSHSHHSLLSWLAPYGQNYVTQRGLIDIPAIGVRPTVLSPVVRGVVTLLVFAAMFACVACISNSPFRIDRSFHSTLERSPSDRELTFLFAPFTLVYFGLLLPRGLAGAMFDRYLLPLLVVLLIVVMRLYQRKVAARLPALSVLSLVIVAAYSVAAMHDFYAMERARVTAANQLLAAGVPRTAFYGGFEYDSWTQVDQWGYVRSLRLNLPPGPQPTWTIATKPCGYIFARMFIAIQPRYALSFDQLACQGPSSFAPVKYRTWLPPRTGSIYIQTVATGAASIVNPLISQSGATP
jgi:hypothetical protein